MYKPITYSYQLDHVRAIGAYLVFVWHFLHVNNLHLVTPNLFLFPISLLSEGHTGVSIFMTLSGYLFSKILLGKKINFKQFYLNRIIRLVPLLFIVIFVHMYVDGTLSFYNFIKRFLRGFFNSWPYAAWSISVEFHFYYLLPFILFFLKKLKKYFLIIFIMTIGYKLYLFFKIDNLQYYSYFKIIGHIDEFLLGFLSYKFRLLIKKRIKTVSFIFFSFLIFFYCFEYIGGFYQIDKYPSNNIIWVFLPFIQGFAYSIIISYYDNNSFKFLKSKFSIILSKIGLWSYSIYLWHFLIIFSMSEFIDKYLIKIQNLYIGIVIASVSFLFFIFIGYLSFNFIEKPFFKFKKVYLKYNKQRY